MSLSEEAVGEIRIEDAGDLGVRVGADHDHLRVMLIGKGSDATAHLAVIAGDPQQMSASRESSSQDSGHIPRRDIHCRLVRLQIDGKLLEHVRFNDVKHLDRTIKQEGQFDGNFGVTSSAYGPESMAATMGERPSGAMFPTEGTSSGAIVVTLRRGVGSEADAGSSNSSAGFFSASVRSVWPVASTKIPMTTDPAAT
jgi:hypothetical protein